MESNKPATDNGEAAADSAAAASASAGHGSEESGDSLYEKKWNAAFSRLKAFKAKYGHCRVPNRYAEDPQLGNWVSTQRRQYRILTTGLNKTVPLTQERAQQLIALGFEWSAKDPSHKCWEDRFQELCDYKRKFGSTLVPMGWKENPRLATWVSTQRQEYKQLKLGHSSRLNEAKVKLLNEIGFVWEAQRGRRKLPNPMDSKLRRKLKSSEKKAGPSFAMTESKLPFQIRQPSSQPSTVSTSAPSNDILLDLARQAQVAAAASSQAALASCLAMSTTGTNRQDLIALIGQLQTKPKASSSGGLPAFQSGNQGPLQGNETQEASGRTPDMNLQGLLGPSSSTTVEALAKTAAPATTANTATVQATDRTALLAALTGTSAPCVPQQQPQDVSPLITNSRNVSTDLLNLGTQATKPNLGNDLMKLLAQRNDSQQMGAVSRETRHDTQKYLDLTKLLIGSQASANDAKPAQDLAKLLAGSQAAAKDGKPAQDLAKLLVGSQTAPNDPKPSQDLAKLLAGSQAAAMETKPAPDLAKLLVGSQAAAQKAKPLPDLAELLGKSQASVKEAQSAQDLRNRLLGSQAAVKKASPTDGPMKREPDQLQQLLSALGKKEDKRNNLTLTPVAGAKRTLEEMLGLQRGPQALSDSNKRQRLPAQGQTAASDTSSAKPAERAGGSGGASDETMPDLQALNMVRLYAASLPVNSPVRFALLTAPSVEEAQTILKADIARNNLSFSTPSLQTQSSLGLQTLLQGVPNLQTRTTTPAAATATTTTTPRASLLESLQSLLPGNPLAAASARALAPQPASASVPLQLAAKRALTGQANGDGSTTVALSLERMLQSKGGEARATSSGTQQASLTHNSSSTESDDRKMPARKSRTDP